MQTLVGQSLGRYHILEQLGEGGMAVVYKAFDTRLERYVAIKVILSVKQQSEKSLKRFEREAKALAQLNHPNIVNILDFGEQDGMLFLVMEYVPGGTLKSHLGKPIPWREAAKLLLPVANALEYAHQHGIIHRDVKPANILISTTGEPMLSDFGVAKVVAAEETTDLTGPSLGVGTPEYMAPEYMTSKVTDLRVDIYALGIVFYELVVGRKPYKADTPLAVLYKQVSEALPRPSQSVADLPEEVEKVILKALAKKPEDRYIKMDDFADALENICLSKTSPQVQNNKHRFPKITLRSNKKNTLFVISAIVTLFLLGVVFLFIRISGTGPFRSLATGTVTPAPISTISQTETPADQANWLTKTPQISQTPSLSRTPMPPIATIGVPDKITEFLNGVQIVSVDEFNNSSGHGWGMESGTIENGVLKVIGRNWNGLTRYSEFTEGEGLIIDFTYTESATFSLTLNYAKYTNQSRTLGAMISNSNATMSVWVDQYTYTDVYTQYIVGNFILQPGTTYSLSLAVIPGGEYLMVIWNAANPSETLYFRKQMGQEWADLHWIFCINADYGTIVLDNYREYKFESAK